MYKNKCNDDFVISGSKGLEGYRVDDLKSKLCTIAAMVGKGGAKKYRMTYGVYPPDVIVSFLLYAIPAYIEKSERERKEALARVREIEERVCRLQRKYELLLLNKEEKPDA
jgi:hypothetical protein